MRRFGNRLQTFAPNVPTFQQNVRANLSNFIQDLFWRVRFSNENFKMVEHEVFKRRFQDGRGRPCQLGDRQDLNLNVPGSTCRSECTSVGCEEGSKNISASNLNELKEKGKTRYT